MEIHNATSNIRSKRKKDKIRAKLQKEQSQKSVVKPVLTEGIGLNDRELQTMRQLLTFRGGIQSSPGSTALMSSPYSQSGTTPTNIHSDYSRLQDIDEAKEVELDESGRSRISKKGVRKKKSLGILSQLNPEDSALPKALTIAIHSTVIDTVKKKDDEKELTMEEKTSQIMEELHSKVDTFWDENTISFPRRSPTIYPGQAYKLTKAEKKAMEEKKEELERREYSLTAEHSDSVDTDDDGKMERNWPNPAREYGHSRNLDAIWSVLDSLTDEELEKVWKFLDVDNKRRLDYKDSLVQLLGAHFLVYFRKSQNAKRSTGADAGYMRLDQQPPSFEEMEPLLTLLAKYIRDALRKKKKKCLKMSDYMKNFRKYLKNAIEKRSKFLERRKNWLEDHHMRSLRYFALDSCFCF